MTLAPSVGVSRGSNVLLPSYFTSSLFVYPLREDVQGLIDAWSSSYLLSLSQPSSSGLASNTLPQQSLPQKFDGSTLGAPSAPDDSTYPPWLRPKAAGSGSGAAAAAQAASQVSLGISSTNYGINQTPQPFSLFKTIWESQGWPFMHFRTLDPRGREACSSVIMRVFIERLVETEPPVTRVGALFGLYTWFETQPSGSAPPLHVVRNVSIPIDYYTSLLSLPETLLIQSQTAPLSPYTEHILSRLTSPSSQIFHIVPHSSFRPLNPSVLPREVFVEDNFETDVGQKRANGRPSKKDNLMRSKAAVAGLDKWLAETGVSLPVPEEGQRNGGARQDPSAPSPPQATTHSLILSHPTTSLQAYRSSKWALLSRLPQETISNANDQLMKHMLEVERMAAERGLETGAEGGDRTSIERVRRAVEEVEVGKKGVLGLLEGAGLSGRGEVATDESLGMGG